MKRSRRIAFFERILNGNAAHGVLRGAIGFERFYPLGKGRFRARQKDVSTAEVADRAGEFSRIDALDPRDPESAHDRTEAFFRAKIRGSIFVLPNDQRADRRRVRFVIVRRHTVIPDQRIGHNDGLIGIGRIGQDLLIADHRRVENEFENALLFRAERATVKFQPVRR